MQYNPATEKDQVGQSCILPYYQDATGTIYQGNVMEVLKSMGDETVQTVVTSPPYW